MPIYMDRHEMEGATARSVADAHQKDLKLQEKYGIKLMTYWFDQSRGSAFCLIDAPAKEKVRQLHEEAHGSVPHKIVEVNPEAVEAFLGRIEDPEPSSAGPHAPSGETQVDSAFRTIMFTDMKDSTALTTRLGDEEAIELFRTHNALTRDVLAQYNGREIQHTGDGFMVSFTAASQAVGCAIDVIDMRTHQGQHPRMGATDVVPFIPIKNISVEEAIAFSKEIAEEVAQKYSLPIFLYEKSASRPERQNLAHIRKGQFEGMAEKIKQPQWKPDFGPQKIHSSAGVTAMGARMPLVAYNVNLGSNNMEIANEIARKVRHINGGLRYCKGIGIELKDRGVVQVSMNMTDYTRTALYRVFELIKVEARRYGVNVIGSEIVGLVPMEALMDTAAYYLGLEDFSVDQVLESRIWE